MELTVGNKKYIDSLEYQELLSKWRFSRPGNPWFQGETGNYWEERMRELRKRPDCKRSFYE